MKLTLSVFFFTVALAGGCDACNGTDKGDDPYEDNTETTEPDSSCPTSYPFTLQSSEEVNGVLTCTYTAEVDCNEGLQPTGVTLEGTGPKPAASSATVTNGDTGASSASRSANGSTDSWTVALNALNCSTLNCADGTYTLTIVGEDCDDMGATLVFTWN